MILTKYNAFCKELRAGTVLYNTNSTNLWGDYLLVVNVVRVRVDEVYTYTALLLGLKKEEGKYAPRNLCVSLTPENKEQIPFLKYVGHCKFTLAPIIEEMKVDTGLVAIYSQIDLHKFTSKFSVRKPRTHKYGKDGKPVIKKIGN